MDLINTPTLSQSIGQDNIGNIISALVDIYVLSMQDGYDGALLCIDEIDVSLHPDTQIRLLNLFDKLSDELSIQFVVSTHSLSVLKDTIKKENKNNLDYKVVYIKNSMAPYVSESNSYELLEADMFGSLSFDKPKVRMYFEDAVIVTGDIGRHGCTILLEREDLGIEADIKSDCAPLWKTVEAVMNRTHDLHVIRDATRGGVGTVLYEIAKQSQVGVQLDSANIPVQPEVRGVCGMLGLEPLYLACEGTMVIIAPKEEAQKIVETLHQCPYSENAAIIGEITEEQPGKVVMMTEIGTQALLPQPGGELLPRIC